MDVPDNLLSVLKCCNCEGYLSCGPIYIIEDGKATCGRCNNTNNNVSETTIIYEQSKTRNIQYENLASIFRFPCKYALFGCPEKFSFSDESCISHEISCTFAPNPCPILPNNQCEWRGSWQQLLEHCEQAHPDNILENLYPSEPYFAEDRIDTYLIPCFNTLFLLRITISVKSERVVYGLYLLDDPCNIDSFVFSIDCKRNNLTVNKMGKIGTADDFVRQKLAICIINNVYLFSKLGAMAGTTFFLKIEQISRITKCKFCPVEIENTKIQDWVCNKCEPNLQYCENKNKNCTFKDINVHKVKKHQQYFCNQISKCVDCNGAITSGQVFEHYISSQHENSSTSKPGIEWIAIPTSPRKLNYVVLKSRDREIGNFLCKYYLDARQFSLIVCSTHSSQQLSLYECTIEVKDYESGFHAIRKVDHVQDFIWDWRLDIDFDINYDEETELVINIKINKIVDVIEK